MHFLRSTGHSFVKSSIIFLSFLWLSVFSDKCVSKRIPFNVAITMANLSSSDTKLPTLSMFDYKLGFYPTHNISIVPFNNSSKNKYYASTLFPRVNLMEYPAYSKTSAHRSPVTFVEGELMVSQARFISKCIQDEYSYNWLINDHIPVLDVSSNLETFKELLLDEESAFDDFFTSLTLSEVSKDSIPIGNKTTGHFYNHFSFVFILEETSTPQHGSIKGIFKPNSYLTLLYAFVLPESTSSTSLQSDIDYAIRSDSGVPLKMTFNVQTRVLFEKDFQFTTWTVWISVIFAFVVVILLALIVLIIIHRTVSGDIMMYNNRPRYESFMTDLDGWKAVHGDVFRRPSNPLVLSVLIGVGIHFMAVLAFAFVLLLFGVISATQNHSLSIVFLVGYLILSSVSGYVSSRFFKFVGGRSSFKLFVTSVLFCPVTICMIFTLFSIFLSSSFISIGSAFYFVFILSLVSVPLHGLGSYYGVKAPDLHVPVQTMEIPRPIPRVSGHRILSPVYLAFISGLLPLTALWLVLRALNLEFWIRHAYTTLAFVSLSSLVFLITVIEVSIITAYIQLCKEDYRWWWGSFLNAVATGIYVFILTSAKHVYFVYYHKLTLIKMIYFCWCLMLSLGISIVAGSVGTISTLFFIRYLYSSVKIC